MGGFPSLGEGGDAEDDPELHSVGLTGTPGSAAGPQQLTGVWQPQYSLGLAWARPRAGGHGAAMLDLLQPQCHPWGRTCVSCGTGPCCHPWGGSPCHLWDKSLCHLWDMHLVSPKGWEPVSPMGHKPGVTRGTGAHVTSGTQTQCHIWDTGLVSPGEHGPGVSGGTEARCHPWDSNPCPPWDSSPVSPAWPVRLETCGT